MKSLTGFTLIEVIVVTAIVGLLSAAVLTNYRAGQREIFERTSVQAIVQAVRTAENKAFGSDCTSPPCRFGAHFDLSLTKIYIFDDGKVAKNNRFDPGEDIEATELEREIALTILSSSYVCGGSSCFDILFEPPDPVITFEPPGTSPVTVTMTGGKTITVGIGGSVDIN
jgi:prepilin-type N-terminal cleavage/methylation domain-containing protein